MSFQRTRVGCLRPDPSPHCTSPSWAGIGDGRGDRNRLPRTNTYAAYLPVCIQISISVVLGVGHTQPGVTWRDKDATSPRGLNQATSLSDWQRDEVGQLVVREGQMLKIDQIAQLSGDRAGQLVGGDPQVREVRQVAQLSRD